MKKIIIFCFILIFWVNSDINKLCVTVEFFEKINKDDLDKLSLENFLKLNQKNVIDGETSQFLKLTWKGRKIGIKKMNSDDNHEEEIKLLKKFSGNKYFPEYYGCIYDQNNKKNVYIMMEALYNNLKEGRLDFLNLKTPFERLDFYIEFAEAITKIHSEGYIHGDISPSNLMVVDATFNNIKIIDFGVSVKTGEPSKGGTLLTNAPEKNEFPQILATSAIDVFAFGITIAFIELGYNKIIENNWDMRVGNILKFFRLFTFSGLNTANPMHIEEPGFWTKSWRWFLGLFIDNRKDSVYNMNDLINNTINTEPEERLDLKSVIEIFKKFQKYHIDKFGSSKMENNIDSQKEKADEKENNKKMENLLFERVHNEDQEEFQKKIEEVAKESEKNLEKEERGEKIQEKIIENQENIIKEEKIIEKQENSSTIDIIQEKPEEKIPIDEKANIIIRKLLNNKESKKIKIGI